MEMQTTHKKNLKLIRGTNPVLVYFFYGMLRTL